MGTIRFGLLHLIKGRDEVTTDRVAPAPPLYHWHPEPGSQRSGIWLSGLGPMLSKMPAWKPISLLPGLLLQYNDFAL